MPVLQGVALANAVLALMTAYMFAHSRQYWAFSATHVSVALWSLFYTVWQGVAHPIGQQVACTLLQTSAIAIPYFFSWAAVSYPALSCRPLVLPRQGWWWVNSVCWVGLVVASVTPFMIAGYRVTPYGSWPIAGPLFLLFLVFFFVNMGVGVRALWVQSKGRRRWVEWMVMVALAGAIVGGASNFPLWVGWDIPPYGNGLVAVYCVTMMWAVVKFQWVDVSVVVSRGVAWGVTMGVVALGVGGMVWGVSGYPVTWQWALWVPAAWALMVGGPALRLMIQTDVSRKFLRGRYQYQQVIERVMQRVGQAPNLQGLCDQLSGILTKELEMGTPRFFFSPHLDACDGSLLVPSPDPEWVPAIHAVWAHMQHTDTVVYDTDPAVGMWLAQVGMVACIPFWSARTLVGIGLVAPKLTSPTLTRDDKGVLQLMMQQSSWWLARWKQSEMAQAFESAKHIQQDSWPHHVSMPRLLFAARTQAMSGVGGDYYDVIPSPHAPGYWIVMGDVMGHGMGASMAMLMVQSMVHTVIELLPTVTPAQLVGWVDRLWSTHTAQWRDPRSVTLQAWFTTDQRTFVMAGHDGKVYWFKAHSHTVVALTPTDAGVPLGMGGEGVSLTNDTIQIDTGDVVVMVSDGVIEALGGEWSDWDARGEARIKHLIKTHHHESVAEIRDAILMPSREEVADDGVRDDVTVVVLKAVP